MTYELSIPVQVWLRQDADGLARLSKLLSELQLTGWTVARHTTLPPAPEVKVVERKVYIYICPAKGCLYESSSKAGVKNHRRVHK